MSGVIDNKQAGLSDGTRGLISLAIFLHLFCVFVGLFGNESASELASRVRRVVGPYTRALNLDAQYPTGFHLTHGMEYEDDHLLVVRIPDTGTVEIYPRQAGSLFGERLGFEHQRWRRLAQEFGRFSDGENDLALAELSRSIGQRALNAHDVERVVVESRRTWPRELESVQAPPDPQTLYTADVLRDINGVVRVHKRVAADESAPGRGSQ